MLPKCKTGRFQINRVLPVRSSSSPRLRISLSLGSTASAKDASPSFFTGDSEFVVRALARSSSQSSARSSSPSLTSPRLTRCSPVGRVSVVSPLIVSQFDSPAPHAVRLPGSLPHSGSESRFSQPRNPGSVQLRLGGNADGACFNPRRPHGRRPSRVTPSVSRTEFQSAPPSRAATSAGVSPAMDAIVSIRAALTGGDLRAPLHHSGMGSFNPRRPHGRRPSATCAPTPPTSFQSAPPSRAATPHAPLVGVQGGSFNPRRPHGRRLVSNAAMRDAPAFQSAPPSRAATLAVQAWATSRDVSIRAALTGGDRIAEVVRPVSVGFNPRRPHGRRRLLVALLTTAHRFQSAPPSRAATLAESMRSMTALFQSAPPSRAATSNGKNQLASSAGFNPRRPHGRRLAGYLAILGTSPFQSAPPSRAATLALPSDSTTPLCFNPRRPHGRRLEADAQDYEAEQFQSAPPSRAATIGRTPNGRQARFQSAPPSRAATLQVFQCRHALHVSIRAALTGGDFASFPATRRASWFQSAPPSRAATVYF
jgi:hypothetical protein